MKHITCTAIALFCTVCALHAQTSHLNTSNILLVDPASGNRLLLAPATLTGNRTFTFPDASGTVALSGSVSFSINGSLIGDGTGGSPLGLNLANANTWSATQTFAGMVNTSTLDQQGAISNSTGNLTLNDVTVVTGELHTQDVVRNPLGNFVIDDNASVIGNLSASVSLTSTGPAFLNGSVGLGDAAADAVTLSGTLTGAGSGHSLGTAATDASVLTVQGADGGANELTVTGDVSVSGTLTSGSFGVTGNLDLNGNDIIDVDDLQFSQATSDISNSNGDVVVNDNLNATGNADVDGTLSVAGTTTLSSTLQLGSQSTLEETLGRIEIATTGIDIRLNPGSGLTQVVGTLEAGTVSAATQLIALGSTLHTGTLDQQGAISNSTGTVAIADDVSVTVDDATNNATTDVLSLVHTTSGTAADGIGIGILFRSEDDGGATEDAARIATSLGTVADGSETSGLSFFTRDAGGALAETMALSGSGNLSIAGSLSAAGFETYGNLNMDGNDIINVDDLQFGQATSDISNTGGDVTVNDNLVVTGTSSFSGSLTLDDVAGGNTTTITEVGIARSADGDFAINTGAAANSGILSTNGLLSVAGTGRAISSLGDGIHVGRDVSGNASIELVTAAGTPYIDFTRNGGATDYDARLMLNGDAEVSLVGASLNLDNNDLTGANSVRIGGATAVTNSRIVINGGHWTSQGAAPTAAGGGTLAAGITVSTNATDVAGRIEATDGGTSGTGTITVTFNSAYASDPIVVVTPGDNNSASGFFVSNITANSFRVNVATTAGDGTTTYSFYYHVIENN